MQDGSHSLFVLLLLHDFAFLMFTKDIWGFMQTLLFCAFKNPRIFVWLVYDLLLFGTDIHEFQTLLLL